MTDDDFEALLAGAKGRQEPSVTALFRAYQPLLLRYLRAQVPRDAADDCASEVWVAVAAGIDRFEGDQAGFRGWLFAIARHRVVDHHRRAGRRRTDPVAEPPARLVAGPEDEVTALISGQRAVELMRDHLSDEQLEVVLLRVLADLDAATVADMLGRDENWVRVTQHRAVRRLAERLGPRLGGTGDRA